MTELVALLDTDAARALTERIKIGVQNVYELITAAYEGQAWKALGYDSWDDYCTQEFNSSQLRLPREERHEVMTSLREHGLSTRAIAAVGTDHSTVVRDLSGGAKSRKNAPPEPVDEDALAEELIASQRPITGLDGRTYKPSQPKPQPAPRPPATLTLYTHEGTAVEYPKPSSKPTFNQSPGEGISWAAWSWNPLTGCLHGCPYCYAREIATSNRAQATYPVGFTPLFHHERLAAPANTAIPARYRDDSHLSCTDGGCQICAYRRVFVCSMADLYGRWVPLDWIEQVHEAMLASPRWQYILLTKFPDRYPGLTLPPGAWVGTSVDEQKRVRIAERAFEKLPDHVVKWLSLEPLREPLEFDDLSMFDWVVIGAQTATRQPDGVVEAFAPPFEWVDRIWRQAKEANCAVHFKPNLHHNPGMKLPNEYPVKG